jgi:hypothetical protein
MMDPELKQEILHMLSNARHGYNVPETRIWVRYMDAALAYIGELEQAVVALSLRCEALEKAAAPAAKET